MMKQKKQQPLSATPDRGKEQNPKRPIHFQKEIENFENAIPLKLSISHKQIIKRIKRESLSGFNHCYLFNPLAHDMRPYEVIMENIKIQTSTFRVTSVKVLSIFSAKQASLNEPIFPNGSRSSRRQKPVLFQILIHFLNIYDLPNYAQSLQMKKVYLFRTSFDKEPNIMLRTVGSK